MDAGAAGGKVIVPPVPELGSSGPSILALTIPVNGIGIDPLAVPEAWNVATATTPLEIVFVLTPARMQIVLVK